jgi:hypothetical protein
MSSGKRWTHDELLLAMNLYCKLPFGQFDQRNSLIMEVAQRMGRSPSSLSMKLCNLASLDPYHQARGIKGLQGASRADRDVWAEFTANWEQYAVASEEQLQLLLGEADGIEPLAAKDKSRRQRQAAIKLPVTEPSGPTEKVVTTRARLGQHFFRQSVLASYSSCCCITGNPIPELLVASHILPWGKFSDQRLNPHNGLCLAQTQDSAFDKGLITLDENYRLVLSPYLREFLPNESLKFNFVDYEGKQILMPEKFPPDGEFMRIHREEVFQSI